jgi:hypothetical protein
MKASVTRGSNFAGLIRYVRDVGPRATGKKGGRLIAGNVDLSLSCAKQARAFQAIASRRPDATRPVLHISLSLPAGEHVSDERWKEIAESFLQKMDINIERQQFVVVRHQVTDFEHIHIVANRVGIDNSLWLGRWELKKAMVATTALEIEFGLKLTPAYDPNKKARKKGPKSGAVGVMRRTGAVPATMKIQQRIDIAKAQSSNFSTFVAALASLDVRILPAGKTGSVPGASFETGGIAVKGSSLGADYAWKSISAAVNFDLIGDAALIAQLRAKATTEVTKDAGAEVTTEVTTKPGPNVAHLVKPKVACSVALVSVTYASRVLFKRRLLEAHYQTAVSDLLARLLKAVVLDRLPKSLLLRLEPSGCVTDSGDKITAHNGTPNEITALVELARIKKWRKVVLSGSDDFIEKCALSFLRAGKSRAQITAKGISGHDAVEKAWAKFAAEQEKTKKLNELNNKKEITNEHDRRNKGEGDAGNVAVNRSTQGRGCSSDSFKSTQPRQTSQESADVAPANQSSSTKKRPKLAS